MSNIRITGDGPKITATGNGSTVLVAVSTGQHDPGSFSGVHNDLSGRSTTAAHPGAAVSIDPAGFVGNLDGTITNAQLLAAAVDSLTGGGGGGAVDSVDGRTGAVTLSDLYDALGAAQAVADTLGDAATKDVGTTAGTVAAGDDSRLSDARTPVSHNHAGTDITSGTVGTARLGSGTATSSTFLRGDQTWATPASGIADPGGSNDDFLQRKSSAWAARTVAQVRTDLGVGTPRGGYYYLNGQSGGNFNPTKDRMYLTPWQPGGPLTITKIAAGVVIVGNSGSVIRLGLYACDSTGQPSGSPLVDGGTIVADSGTGVKEVTVSTAITDRMICMAFVWQVGTVGSGATNGVSAVGATLGHLIGSSTAILGASAFPASCWYQDGVTGALPTISLTGTLGDFAPRMIVKGS